MKMRVEASWRLNVSLILSRVTLTCHRRHTRHLLAICICQVYHNKTWEWATFRMTFTAAASVRSHSWRHAWLDCVSVYRVIIHVLHGMLWTWNWKRLWTRPGSSTINSNFRIFGTRMFAVRCLCVPWRQQVEKYLLTRFIVSSTWTCEVRHCATRSFVQWFVTDLSSLKSSS